MSPEQAGVVDRFVFYLPVAMLVLVPLAFVTPINAKYALPKFTILLIGSSLLTFLLISRAIDSRGAGQHSFDFKSRGARIVCAYFIVVAISTLFGVSPLVSFFGSNSSFMGLITRLCFLVCWIGLIVGVGASERRLRVLLWAMALAGFLVSGYAVAQFFGVEPFAALSTYTFDSRDGPVIRVCSSLGHSNYLGNFLLYTTPLTLGLAFTSGGKARLGALVAALLSIAAIVFSGTRGAWLGIVVGIAVFAALELKEGSWNKVLANKRRVMLVSGSAVVILVVAGSLIAITPTSRSISERARALMIEGLSSSGRVVLWRDSIKMIPGFAFVGCGPEGFRKALLAYKSDDLALLSPKANNESPHNSYLEAAISHGLAGAALYVSIIAYAIVCLWRARRKASSRTWRIIATGVLASFIAVLTHNLFIFDQITNGLYFFAFVGVAFTMPGIAGSKAAHDKAAQRMPKPVSARSAVRWQDLAVTSAGFVVVVAAGWYCVGLFQAEVAYRRLFDPLNPLDYRGMLEQGERITNSPLPTGAYDFLYARALQLSVQRISVPPSSTKPLEAKDADLAAIRTEVLRLGISHAEKSLAHTNTPDMNYSLLASLALTAGDIEKARAAAVEAVKWDPNNYHTKWLMAEAHLARGENEQAISEAKTALRLYPSSEQVAATLSRARGNSVSDRSAITEILAQALYSRSNPEYNSEQLIEIARRLSSSGRLQKARITLLTAIDRANGPCPVCHRELALVMERMGRIKDAVVEWEAYMKEDGAAAAAEGLSARIESLRKQPDVKP